MKTIASGLPRPSTHLAAIILAGSAPQHSLATFVATMALVSYSTVGMWMPLFLAQQHGWSTAEYGSFLYLVGTVRDDWLLGRRWMTDRLGRRVGFAVLLIEAAVFMTIWIFAHDKIAFWLLGMAWSWALLACGGQ